MAMPAQFTYQEDYIQNSRGMRLFTCSWIPDSQDIKALVFLCHGYAVECSIFMKGHGKSDGTRCYIEDVSTIVDDIRAYFKLIKERPEYKNKPSFLFGESMGGCMALHVHRKEPTSWSGAILVAPMCKILENMKPHPVVVKVLTTLSPIIGRWRVVPSKDLCDMAYKVPTKREEIRKNNYIYQGKTRVNTGVALLNASTSIEKRLDEVTLPFLVLHGDADKVTDPECSRALYKSARSFDKELKLYSGMWHGLLVAEPDENVDLVFSDIVSWLDKRSASKHYKNTNGETTPHRDTLAQLDHSTEQKLKGLHDFPAT